VAQFLISTVVHFFVDNRRLRPNLILVHKLDRFARNRDDAGHYRWLFKKMGGSRLIAVDQDFGDTPEAALVEGNIESVAEYFSKNLSREVKKGLYESVVQGMHCGGLAPLGYDVGPDKKYIINEYEAQAVRMIFDMKVKGYSYPDIMKALNEAGYRTKKRGIWQEQSA
jgi:site-specific DNA recombinase